MENLSTKERSYYLKLTYDSIGNGLLFSIGFDEKNKICTFKKKPL